MARLSDKEFNLRFELTQLKRDKDRLLRIKERTDSDLDETTARIHEIKKELKSMKVKKPKQKKPAKKKGKDLVKAVEEEEIARSMKEAEEPEKSEVKIDANTMTAVEDSRPIKKITAKKEKEADNKTDPADESSS